jgi:antitoxin component HigA of HigAB toxin-antitoxin module
MEPIKKEEEYLAALARLDELFEIAQRSKDEQREFDRLAELIELYEEENWPLDGD